MIKYITKKNSINFKTITMSKKEAQVEVPQVEETQEDVQQDAKALVITIQLAEALIGYLKSKPMVEVEALVSAIAQSQQVTISQEPKE